MESKNNELQYRHFGHDHSLDYTKLQPHSNATCSGCRQPIAPGKFYYRCKLCGFYLHQVCYSMPENVTHPSDPNHNLTLETFPTTTKVPITCKSCETPIKGFYYRCSKCTHYYHTLCLAAPLSMKTPLHRHALNIEFAPVYNFQCDLCEKPSYSGWVYHCNLCEFDVHLSCVLTTNKGLLQTPDVAHAPPTPRHVADQRRDELMELITRSSNNMPQDHDISMLSMQFSEACFSIDFQKSLMGNDDPGDVFREVGIPEEKRVFGGDESEGYETSKRSDKSRSSTVDSRMIGAHIWTELEQATEKRNSKGKDRAVELDTRRSSSGFMCCFPRGKIVS